MANNFLVKVLNNRVDGKASVGHYYHMVADLILPLYHSLLVEKSIGHQDTVYIRRESKLQNKLANFLPFQIRLFDKNSEVPADVITIKYRMGFPQMRKKFTPELAHEIQRNIFEINGVTYNPEPSKILMIKREVPQKFMPSKKANTGLNRRSIPNFDKLHQKLSEIYPDRVVYRSLEDLSVKEQCDIFNDTNVLIAQHGAALVNNLLMSPGSVVYEIVSHGLPFFIRTSEVMEHRHLLFPQKNPNSHIHIPTFLNYFKINYNRGSKT